MTQQLLAFDQVNETDGSTMAHLDITQLEEELQARYHLGLYHAFPEAPLTNQWPLEAVQTVVATARLRLSQASVGNVPMQSMDKHLSELSPAEVDAANRFGRVDHSGPDGQAWVKFQMPQQQNVDPIYNLLQQELDAVAQFMQNGAASHDLLRNLAISGEPEQTQQESEPEPVSATPIVGEEEPVS